nr:MAG TPA: hypothetical protein [Microviridae sp.]
MHNKLLHSKSFKHLHIESKQKSHYTKIKQSKN